MSTSHISPGDRVAARNAFGVQNARRALTPIVEGEDFPVVWVCTEQEWGMAQAEGRDPEGIPFPVEDVSPLAMS